MIVLRLFEGIVKWWVHGGWHAVLIVLALLGVVALCISIIVNIYLIGKLEEK